VKKIIYLFALTLTSCTFLGDVTPEGITSIRDQDGDLHIYVNLKLGQENWCYEHKQHELVELRSSDE